MEPIRPAESTEPSASSTTNRCPVVAIRDDAQHQVAGELLIPPAGQHRFEHLLLGVQQGSPTHHEQPVRATRNLPGPTHAHPIDNLIESFI